MDDDEDMKPIGVASIIMDLQEEDRVEDGFRFLQALKHRPGQMPTVFYISRELGAQSWFRKAMERHAGDPPIIFHMEMAPSEMEQRWPEAIKGFGFSSAVIDEPEPIKEIAEPIAEPINHQAERPWSTPNRKRFKRANRRRK